MWAQVKSDANTDILTRCHLDGPGKEWAPHNHQTMTMDPWQAASLRWTVWSSAGLQGQGMPEMTLVQVYNAEVRHSISETTSEITPDTQRPWVPLRGTRKWWRNGREREMRIWAQGRDAELETYKMEKTCPRVYERKRTIPAWHCTTAGQQHRAFPLCGVCCWVLWRSWEQSQWADQLRDISGPNPVFSFFFFPFLGCGEGELQEWKGKYEAKRRWVGLGFNSPTPCHHSFKNLYSKYLGFLDCLSIEMRHLQNM